MTPARYPQSPASRAARGFTLVETMVAMTIGLVILLAVSVLYSRNSSNFTEIEKTGDLLENGRYALDVITDDLQHAGFYAEINSAALSVTWTSSGAPCNTDPTALGWDTSTSSPSMPPAVLGTGGSTALSCLTNRVDGQPALTVRHASVDAPIAPSAAVTGNLYLQVSRCPNDTRQIIASNDKTKFTLQNIGCTGPINEVRRFEVRTYYVATCSVCSPSDNLPTLDRVELIDGSMRYTPIAEGIEKIAFEYGIDGDGDGKPDEFVDASLVTGTPATRVWQNVVSVRVTLLARARTATTGYVDPRTYTIAGVAYTPGDSFKRTLLTSTVRLENVGGRLEH